MTAISYRPLLPSRVGFIVVHCSATKPSQDFDVDDIRRMHLKRGFFDVGYHYIIKRDGVVEPGRPLDRQGAHVQGYNHLSVGICLIGGISEDKLQPNGQPVSEDNFTAEQWHALKALLPQVKANFPHAEVLGHRDMPHVHKDCPCFDVRQEIEKGRLH